MNMLLGSSYFIYILNNKLDFEYESNMLLRSHRALTKAEDQFETHKELKIIGNVSQCK